jgi:hypothetical protein
MTVSGMFVFMVTASLCPPYTNADTTLLVHACFGNWVCLFGPYRRVGNGQHGCGPRSSDALQETTARIATSYSITSSAIAKT